MIYEEIKEEKSQTYQIKKFKCTKCSEIFTSQENFRYHYVEKHAVKEEKCFGGEQFYFFETSEDFNAYVAEQHRVVSRCKFSSPGFYKFEYSSEPCRRGCCRDSVIESTSLEEEICNYYEKESEIKKFLMCAEEYLVSINQEMPENYYKSEEN